jgi:ribosomal protein S20
MNLINDIYYSKEYVSLYIQEDEELFEFKYQKENNIFYNISIKRSIDQIGNMRLNEKFYDLESAYGYGGFYTNSNDKSFIKIAMKKYEEKCQDENIIAEFMRFHPFNNFPKYYSNFLDFNFYDRDVVVKDLSSNILSSYKSKVRNIIKRSNEKVIIQKSENIDNFIELYNKTMYKNNADKFYFFDKSYYIDLLENKNIELYEVQNEGEIISMGFFMFGEDIAHYHLSANSDLSYKLNTNYALLNYAFNQAKERKISNFILGGGTTSSKEDNLFKFKNKFSKDIKPFYISGKIYNQEIYDKYNKIWQEQSKEDIKYFLKYRLETK